MFLVVWQTLGRTFVAPRLAGVDADRELAVWRMPQLFRVLGTGCKEGRAMAFKELTEQARDDVLAAERVVRVGFTAHGESYLVPLGFVWHRGALYASTTRGRKTEMAAANPHVSFQVDTSARTGPFTWQSVSGEGTFEVVTDAAEIAAVDALLVSRFPDMPDWMQAELAEQGKQGRMVYVRIRPTRLTGRTSAP